MNFVLIALVAALRVAGASSAYTTGTLTTVTTDTVPIALRGDEWATAQFVVSSAGTATATAQVSIDGGTNWLPSAYCKKISTASANPAVQAITATTLVTADAWECPLPGNATHFRLQCGGTGTTTSVQVSSGAPFVPGIPVVATLADVTESGTGAGIAATTFDVSGWQGFTAYFNTPTTQVFTIQALDDTGTALGASAAGSMVFVTTAATKATASILRAGSHQTISATLGSGVWVAVVAEEKRWSVALPAGGTVSTGRYRITAMR